MSPKVKKVKRLSLDSGQTKLFWKGFTIADVRTVTQAGVDHMQDIQGMGFAMAGARIVVLLLDGHTETALQMPTVTVAIDNGTGMSDLFPVTGIDRRDLIAGTDREEVKGFVPSQF